MRALVIALSLLLLPGCSTVKLVYNNLDTLANWAVDSAVDFTDPQEAQFDAEFAALWHWHRHTQLPRYAADLHDLAVAVEQPMTAAGIEAYSQRARGHVLALYEQALPPSARLLALLDDAQVDRLMEKTREERHRQSPPERSDDERRKDLGKDMRSEIRDWIGRLQPEQEARIAEFVAAVHLQSERWQDYQRRWETDFQTLLKTRHEPDFEQRLDRHFDENPQRRDAEMERRSLENRRAWFALMSDLSGSLTPSQRAHLQQRLRAYAELCEELAAETVADRRVAAVFSGLSSARLRLHFLAFLNQESP